MANYEELLHGAHECWQDAAQPGRRRFLGAHSTLNNKNDSTAKDSASGVAETLDPVAKHAWRGGGAVANYVPAWERKFQKSLQEKQARLHSLQQQSS